jgi:hypothetical protein
MMKDMTTTLTTPGSDPAERTYNITLSKSVYLLDQQAGVWRLDPPPFSGRGPRPPAGAAARDH